MMSGHAAGAQEGTETLPCDIPLIRLVGAIHELSV